MDVRGFVKWVLACEGDIDALDLQQMAQKCGLCEEHLLTEDDLVKPDHPAHDYCLEPGDRWNRPTAEYRAWIERRGP